MSANKTVKVISAKDAYDIIASDARSILIDIRSSMEYLFVGHPVGAIHVPWIDEPDWTVNKNFVTDIRKLVLGGAIQDSESDSVHLILICRSGKRSREAAQVLLEAGFDNIYHIDEGFEGELSDDHQRSTLGGWRFHGLPWEQC